MATPNLYMTREKYACRLVTNTGNAFELVTYMDRVAIRDTIRKAKEEPYDWAKFDGISETDEPIYLEVDPTIITGFIHHLWHPPVPKHINPTLQLR